MTSTVRPILISLLSLAAGCAADDSSSAEPDAGLSGTMTVAAPPMARVVRNGSVEVPVTISRSGFDGDVTVEVSGLPASVSAGTATIAAGETTGKLAVSAEAAAMLASRTEVTLHASAGDIAADAEMDVVIADPPGTLDTTFDTDGKVFADLAGGANDIIMAMVRQQSGGIVVVSNDLTGKSVRWARIDSTGQPDPTFGPQFIDSMSIVNTNASLQQRADGSLVLAYIRGEGASAEAVVAGFDGNGQLLAGFGEGGAKLTLSNADLGISPDRVTLATGPAGELYVALASNTTVKIGKLTASGMLDSAFGTSGLVTVTAIGMSDMSVDPMGRFVIAGGANQDRSVVRLTAAGELDTSFSSDGRVTIAAGSTENFLYPVFLPGERMALATGLGGTYGISMLQASGDPDSAFDGDGIVASTAYPLRFTTFGDELVVAGGNDSLFSRAFMLQRMSATTGAPTPGFGTEGLVTVDFFPNRANANVIVIDDLGRAVLGGFREEGDYDSTLLRIWL